MSPPNKEINPECAGLEHNVCDSGADMCMDPKDGSMISPDPTRKCNVGSMILVDPAAKLMAGSMISQDPTGKCRTGSMIPYDLTTKM